MKGFSKLSPQEASAPSPFSHFAPFFAQRAVLALIQCVSYDRQRAGGNSLAIFNACAAAARMLFVVLARASASRVRRMCATSRLAEGCGPRLRLLRKVAATPSSVVIVFADPGHFEPAPVLLHFQ